MAIETVDESTGALETLRVPRRPTLAFAGDSDLLGSFWSDFVGRPGNRLRLVVGVSFPCQQSAFGRSNNAGKVDLHHLRRSDMTSDDPPICRRARKGQPVSPRGPTPGYAQTGASWRRPGLLLDRIGAVRREHPREDVGVRISAHRGRHFRLIADAVSG